MMLPKFSRLESEDVYMFISEFEVCILMKIQQLSDDAIKLRFIPFSIKDNAKKWLYSLGTNSIMTRVKFVAIFLKFFQMYKTTRIRSKITNSVNLTRNPSKST